MEGAVERVIRKPASGSEYSRWVLLPVLDHSSFKLVDLSWSLVPGK